MYQGFYNWAFAPLVQPERLFLRGGDGLVNWVEVVEVINGYLKWSVRAWLTEIVL